MNYFFSLPFISRVVFFALISSAALGKQISFEGYTFPIQEKSLKEVVEKRSRQSAPLKAQSLENYKPKAIDRITEARSKKTFYFEPSHTATEDVRDTEGRIVVKKGERAFPLKTIHLSSGLIFIDGTQKSHLKFASEQKGLFKWVLVKGDPLKLERALDRPMYFDQGGKITKRLGISCVPSVVVQEGSRLKIEEVPVGTS